MAEAGRFKHLFFIHFDLSACSIGSLPSLSIAACGVQELQLTEHKYVYIYMFFFLLMHEFSRHALATAEIGPGVQVPLVGNH